MENSSPRPSEDVLKPHDEDDDTVEMSKDGKRSARFRGILGLESPSEGNEKSDGKKSLLDKILPQPDLVEAGPDDPEAKKGFLSKVSEVLRRMSSSDEAQAEEGEQAGIADVEETESVTPAIPEVNTAQMEDPPGETTSESAQVSEAVQPTVEVEEPGEPLEAPTSLPEANGGDDGEEPPVGPPEAPEAPEPTGPDPEVQTILAQQSAVEVDDSAAGHGGAGDPYITNNYQRADLLPALVVDQLSRHRDRKIKRHDRAQDKTTAQLKKQVDVLSDKMANQQLPSQEKRPKPVASVAAEQVLRQASSVERPEQITPAKEQEQRPSVFTNTESRPEVSPAIPAEKTRAELVDKRVNALEKMAPKGAESIQKTVEEAAEAAIPIESLYERRHELKGNEDFSAAAEAAIKRKSSTNNNNIVENIPANVEQQMKIPQNAPVTDRKKELYHQAAQGGALAAAAFITAFLILYFLF